MFKILNMFYLLIKSQIHIISVNNVPNFNHVLNRDDVPISEPVLSFNKVPSSDHVLNPDFPIFNMSYISWYNHKLIMSPNNVPNLDDVLNSDDFPTSEHVLSPDP